MYSFESTVVTESGERFTESTSFYGRDLFIEGRRSARLEARRFGRLAAAALPAPQAAEESVEPVPDFANDPSFGRAWKSLVAWKAITGHVLSESAFFSIAHTLEAEADLDASVLLASRLYYKHALQTLRTMVEDVVMPLYFCIEPTQFDRWRVGQHATPRLRGPNGILGRLVAAEALANELADRVGALYGRLNGAIHASEKHLIHRGSDYGQYRGETFKRDDFDEWANDLAEIVAVGSSLVGITFERWRNVRREHPLMCDICHNWKKFTMTRSTFAGEEQVQVRCDVCHHESNYDAEYVDGIAHP